jgi:hypothetical protein
MKKRKHKIASLCPTKKEKKYLSKLMAEITPKRKGGERLDSWNHSSGESSRNKNL